MIFSTPPEAPYYTLTHSPWAAIKRLRCGKLGANCSRKTSSKRPTKPQQTAGESSLPFHPPSWPTGARISFA